MALPDGLSKDDLMNGVVRVTEPSEGIDLDAGVEQTATIEGLDFREVQYDGDEYYYVDFDLEIGGQTFESFDGFSLNEGKINENTGLGAFASQLGVDLDALQNDDLNLHDALVGKSFTFEGEEDEDGYLIIQRDDDGHPVVQPADGDDGSGGSSSSSTSSSDSDSGGDGDGDADEDERAAVAGIVEENIGDTVQDVKKTIAKQDATLIGTWNEMVEDGSVEVDDEDDMVLDVEA